MSMRPKTKRRLIVLIAAVVLIGVVLGGLVFVQQRRNEQKVMAFREQGMERYRAGDYEGALKPLSNYHTVHPDDPETRYAFAIARSKVPDQGGYIVEAIRHLEYYISKRPADTDAKRLLLELYNKVAWNTEAVLLADELLKKDANDAAALRYKALAKYRLQKYEEALEVSEKLNELLPLDLDGQLLTYQIMYNMRRPVDEVLKRAERQRLAHPDDPRFEILQAYALMYANQPAEAEQWLDRATAHVGDDPDTMMQLVRLYDQLQKFDKAQKLLEQAVDKGANLELTRALVHRLWRGMRYRDVVQRTEKLDPADEKSDTQLLAYRAFSLYELRRTEEARPIVAALEKRGRDDNARGWALAMTARFENPDQDVRQKIEQYNAAISRAPRNPVIRFLLGEAYLSMHENELALDSWQKAIDLDPSWAMPWSQRARLLATTGRVDAAVQEALQAVRRAPTVASAIAYALATYYKAVQSGTPADFDRALKVAEMLHQQVANEPETLPIYLTLLVQAGQRDKAVAILRTVLAADSPPPMELLLNLASVNRRHQLGLEDALFAKAEQAYGSAPSVAYARAMDLFAAGDAAAGVGYLKSMLAKAPPEKALPWRVALARVMEVIDDPDARDVWIALGEEFQNSLQVQSAVLEAESPRADRAFVRRTIDRVRKLTGEQAYTWRIAQARWLLGSDGAAADRDRDIAAAIVLLTDMLRTSPTLVEPRLLLAQAMEATNNPAGAIGQLNEAQQLRPESIDIALELARIYQNQAKFDDARRQLDAAAAGTGLTLRQRLRTAFMYAQQAEYARALALIEAIPVEKRDPRLQLLLAQLYRQTGAFDQAVAIYEALLSQKTDQATILAAADLYAARGRLDDARRVLARLNELKLTPAQRELLLGEFAEKFEGPEQALAHYRAAIDAAPTTAAPHLALVRFYLRQEKFADAATAAEAGLKQVPDDATLRSARDRATALGSGDAENLQDVIEALAADPRQGAAVRTLRVLDEARDKKQSPQETLAALIDVANQYPRFLPVYKEIVRRCLTAGQPDQAATYAQRIMDALPTSAEAARLATETYAVLRRPTQMLTAAQGWRKRAMENPRLADVAIAEAELALGRPQAALTQLQPYVQQIKANPAGFFGLTNVYARALILTGKEQDAAELLLPLARQSAQWRIAWLNLIAVTPRGADADAGRIRQVEALIDKDSLPEQIALGRLWYDMAQRYGYRPGMEAARTIFGQLAGRPDADSGVFLLLGSASEAMDDWTSAEAAYRKAIEKDPKNGVTMNQLAYALLQRGQKLEEARELAQRAVQVSPAIATIWDTLARIHARMGQHDAAIKAFGEAIRLQPSNLEALIGMASSLVQLDRKSEAREIMRSVENLVKGAPPLPADVQQQLRDVRKALQA